MPCDNGSYVLLTNHLVPTRKCILQGVVGGLSSPDIDLDPIHNQVFVLFVFCDCAFVCVLHVCG